MKVTNLMIGDWVLFNGKSKKVTSLLVTDLGVDQIYVFGNSCQVATISEYIEPIPLTTKILEKNGFLHDGESWWYQDFRIVLSTSKGVSLVCGRQIKFAFVHELQHALKLCGIDKEIEL